MSEETTVMMQEMVTISLAKYEDLKKFREAIEEKKSVQIRQGYDKYFIKVLSDNEAIKILIQSIEQQAVRYEMIYEELRELKQKYKVK